MHVCTCVRARRDHSAPGMRSQPQQLSQHAAAPAPTDLRACLRSTSNTTCSSSRHARSPTAHASLQDEYKDLDQSVIASDFYYAPTIMHLPDDAIAAKVKANLDFCEPQFRDAKVVDSAVLKFPKAVTHFSTDSYQNRPFQATSIPNLFMSGDWVKGVDHGASGLCQERAYVTGLIAANLVMSRLGQGSQAAVRPVEPDEPHIELGRRANRAVKDWWASTGIRNPFL
jgi:uncharacterized protein with NAD-binding domain and iron-sulfur cluster